MDTDQPKPRQRKPKQGRVPPKDMIALVTALIALLAAILNAYYTFWKNTKQDEEIRELAECAGIAVQITEPSTGNEVPERFFVNGTATPSRTCNFMFVFLRDRNRPVWKVVDLVQSDGTGKWAAVAQANESVQIGNEAEVVARVTRQPNDYVVGTYLSTPPTRGNPSTNAVQVRRVR